MIVICDFLSEIRQEACTNSARTFYKVVYARVAAGDFTLLRARCFIHEASNSFEKIDQDEYIISKIMES